MKDGYVDFLGTSKTHTNKTIKVTTSIGQLIQGTEDHIIYTCAGAVALADIKIGDAITNTSVVTDIDVLHSCCEVYDIMNVNNYDHSFIANDIHVSNCLIIDEAAFIPENIMVELWASVYPIVSADPNSKVIMVSTPKGIDNLFYRLYAKAE